MDEFVVSPAEQRRRIKEARARLGRSSNRFQDRLPQQQQPEQPTARPWIDEWDNPVRGVNVTFGWSTPSPLMPKSISPKRCAEFVAARHGYTYDDIVGDRKPHRLPDARHITLWILHRHTKRGYAELARLFNRDHSTVIHGVKRIKKAVADKTELGAIAIQIERDFMDDFLGISNKIVTARFQVK